MNLVYDVLFGLILIVSIPLLQYWLFSAGVIREFVIEVDANLKFQLGDNKKELRVSLSHLSILSQQIKGTLQNSIQIPHFFSNLFSHPVAGELDASSQHAKRAHIDSDASSSKHPVSHKFFSGNSHFTGPFCFSCRHYLLENLIASLSIEKTCRDHVGILSKAWAGKGSLSGLDLILSHSEIQVSPNFKKKLCQHLFCFSFASLYTYVYVFCLLRQFFYWFHHFLDCMTRKRQISIKGNGLAVNKLMLITQRHLPLILFLMVFYHLKVSNQQCTVLFLLS